jgi:TRAP-type C4-dicarboxylate transport system substrate-binding protein
MKGLRIKGGPEHIDSFKQLGVEPDMTPMAEIYIALQKGMVDGTICPYEALKTMRLAEVAKFLTLIPSARGAYPSKAFNLDSWNKLPPDIQKIFEDNGDWHGLQIAEEFMKEDEEGLAFAKEQGVEFITPPQAEVDRWVEMMNAGAIKTAKALDAKGLPGSKIFNRVQQLIKESKK